MASTSLSESLAARFLHAFSDLLRSINNGAAGVESANMATPCAHSDDEPFTRRLEIGKESRDGYRFIGLHSENLDDVLMLTRPAYKPDEPHQNRPPVEAL